MKYNNNWVYRCIYGCHYIMSINTNKIVSISPLFAEFFGKLNQDTVYVDDLLSEWVASLQERGIHFNDECLKTFIDNGVLTYE